MSTFGSIGGRGATLRTADGHLELNLKFHSNFPNFFSNWITSPYAADPSSYRLATGLGHSRCVVRGEVVEIRKQSRSRTVAIRPQPTLDYRSSREGERVVDDRGAISSMISIQYDRWWEHWIPMHWIYSGLMVRREACA
jgi:hypothetical protein